ncbi:MAG TPA: 16S rRNA (guanine(966)-N(2))-methyltransferase RsmD [Rhizomicrobium sp.]|jgi:16S rRNA (guanine966-N2)-methyltransferase
MRVTGGIYGGRQLVSPRDMSVRPTSDRTRQAIFNILMHKDFGIGFALEGAAVLDLFAGTGALGIEALSHGARWCLFVDDSADSRALQRENVEALNLTGATRIWRRDATDLGPIGPSANGPFNLVFLDPPYRREMTLKALASLKAGGWLLPNALVVAETDAKEPLDAPGYEMLDERDYGETRVRFLTLAFKSET